MSPAIALVDDHILIRNGIAAILHKQGYQVLFEADNGVHFLEKLKEEPVPDIVLMDLNMPYMDGYETTSWLKRNYPQTKVLALSMYDSEKAILRIIRAGAKGFILKDAHPSELKVALQSLAVKGFYQSDVVTGRLIHSINQLDESDRDHFNASMELDEKEKEFLKWACTELTYKEVADKMCVSPRTIDSYRDALFQKLNIKSRVGLVLFAIKEGIVTVT